MAISGIAANGLISGLDTNSLIAQILNVERGPINLLASRKNDYELKIASILSLSSKLSSYKSSMEALNSVGKYNTKTASVSNTTSGNSLLSVSASSIAEDGNYSIKVNQLATADKMASQGWVDQNTTAINSSGGTFMFKVGSSGAESSISVNSTMTLQGLRDAINTADSDVTASIINDGTGSNPYRLILTANSMGSSNEIIVTDNTIAQNLGFTDGAGGIPKKVEAAYAYTDNSYSGTVISNEGDNYTGTTNKTFMVEIVEAGASTVATYKYSTDGGINWLGSGGTAYSGSNQITTQTASTAVDGTGASNEGVEVSFSAGSDLVVGDRFTIDVFNPEMQDAKDAVIQVDNYTIVKASNTISDVITGVTMNLLEADASSTLTLTVSSDTSSAKKNIESYVSSYNSLYEFIENQLSYDPEIGKASPLLGDSTLLEIKSRISNTVSGSIPGLSTASYTNLSQIGITSDYKTGELSIDSTILNEALSTDTDGVANLFIGTATPTNQAVTFVSKTSDTLAGTYGISISRAPEQAIISGDIDLSSQGLGDEETLVFMYSENKTSNIPIYDTFSVTLNQGSTINTIVNNLNSAFATKNVGLSASNDGGMMKITSTDYGADTWFQVTTDQGNDINSDQIWSSGNNDTLQSAGVDISGSINDHVAIGKGNILTAGSGFNESGLQISTTSNQTGLFGTIRVSLGIADRLPSIIDSYSDSDSGVLKLKENSMNSSVDDIEERIERLEYKLIDKEERMRAEFTRLEVLLAKYNSISQYLMSAMSALPNNWYVD